ncbi:MAG: hypothetical protein VKJ02_14975 [Snowella sp.]|nr:hypothetical protein [Snowella sp.]
MTDNELKNLIESNAKSIAALADAMAADREERRAERNQRYQYLGRIAAAQSNFYEVQADYYHQLAALSERQTRTEEQMVKILRHLSLSENSTLD